MISRTTIKIALALAAFVLFGVSVRFNSDAYRWAAIALAVVAVLMRFWKPPVDRV